MMIDDEKRHYYKSKAKYNEHHDDIHCWSTINNADGGSDAKGTMVSANLHPK